MLKTQLPPDAFAVMEMSWPQFEGHFQEMLAADLREETLPEWLAQWTAAGSLIFEAYSRLQIATTVNTEDKAAVERLHRFLKEIIEPAAVAENQLKRKLIDSEVTVPEDFEMPLKKMRTEAEIFRPENVPLGTQEEQLTLQYNQIAGAQTVTWDGEEKTLTQLKPLLHSDDRSLRERVWRAISERRLADREKLNTLWGELLPLRLQMAHNAGFESFRDYRWKQFRRFDYTPEDCITFHAAIEQYVVPAATRIYERKRAQLGVETLRPWDLDRDDVYSPSRPPLHPFQTIDEMESKAEAIFDRVDPLFGGIFRQMRGEGLLDLDNRKGKGPGGYQASLPHVKRPFIFMNAVGLHDDVQTLLHEGGHAFHAVETMKLPYSQQWDVPIEMCEVASMSMELLASPYLAASEGGYYSSSHAAHARIEHLEHMLLFWPFMAVVDAFQHWVYTHADQARDAAACDAAWGALWARFIPGVDWSGLEDTRVTGWHRKLHIFCIPFYYVDYGLAQVGAAQVWRNSRQDYGKAVQDYTTALGLGGTKPLPELFAAAGARFAFDGPTMKELTALIEGEIDSLLQQV